MTEKIYYKLLDSSLFFSILMWFRSSGISRNLSYILLHKGDSDERENATEEMIASKRFYEENKDRCERMLSWLADDKSREIWGGCVAYRTERVPLTSDMYSLDDQYFVEDVVKLKDHEVFIDCGAYIGDTIWHLLRYAKKEKVKLSHVVAFELVDENCRKLKRNLRKLKDNQMTVINKGLWDKEGYLSFEGEGQGTKIVESEGVSSSRNQVEVTTIDDTEECRDATFIKMDIEGAEMKALLGAKNTIIRNHPKLAICLYHSDEDMVRIAEYIHDIAPNYKLYIRHHTRSKNETVLYAI